MEKRLGDFGEITLWQIKSVSFLTPKPPKNWGFRGSYIYIYTLIGGLPQTPIFLGVLGLEN